MSHTRSKDCEPALSLSNRRIIWRALNNSSIVMIYKVKSLLQQSLSCIISSRLAAALKPYADQQEAYQQSIDSKLCSLSSDLNNTGNLRYSSRDCSVQDLPMSNSQVLDQELSSASKTLGFSPISFSDTVGSST